MTTTVGEMVRQNPNTAVVFLRNGIDFCCNGNDSLDVAVRRANADMDLINSQLKEINSAVEIAFDFDAMSLSQLIDHILGYHHEYIYKSGDYIRLILNRVCEKHGDNHPELAQIKSLTDTILNELPLHQQKEEMILFPYIKTLEEGLPTDDFCFGTVTQPIAVMESDHLETGRILFEIRNLSDNFTPPADACNSYDLLYKLLKAMVENIQQHIHLENNLLHPKAMAMEQSSRQVV